MPWRSPWKRRRRILPQGVGSRGGSHGGSLTGIILVLVLIGVGVIIYLLVR